MATEQKRATITLPAWLLELLDDAVKNGMAKSRNQLVTRAIEELLKRTERERIDAAFSRMSEDIAYQKEASRILTEFEGSDLETLKLAGED